MIILYTLKLNKVFNRMPNFNLIDSKSFFVSEAGVAVFYLWDRASLCLPGWPRTQRSTCPDSQVLRLKVHTSMPSYSNLCIQTFHSLYFAVSPECIHRLPAHCPGVLLPSYRKLPVAWKIGKDGGAEHRCSNPLQPWGAQGNPSEELWGVGVRTEPAKC